VSESNSKLGVGVTFLEDVEEHVFVAVLQFEKRASLLTVSSSCDLPPARLTTFIIWGINSDSTCSPVPFIPK